MTGTEMIVVFAVFIAGGILKGLVGVGLSTICLGLLAIKFDVKTAVTLQLVPALVTNFWQCSAGDQFTVVLKRIWPVLAVGVCCVGLGAQAFVLVDIGVLNFLLGLTIFSYALLVLVGFGFSVSPKKETFLAPLIGCANGTLTGMTGSFVVPGVMYYQSLRFSTSAFVQAMGIHFTAFTLALFLWFGVSSLLTLDLLVLSAGAVVPACLGMVIGRALQRRLPVQTFRSIFNISLALIGIYVAGGSLNQTADVMTGRHVLADELPVSASPGISHVR